MALQTFERVKRNARSLQRSGGVVVSPGHVETDVSGNCMFPNYVELTGRRTAGPDGYVYSSDGLCSVRTSVLVACNRCPTCAQNRYRLWYSRAITEVRLAPRTWFGTLTFKPEVHYQNDLKIDREKKTSYGAAKLSVDQLWAFRCDITGREVQKYIKRLRKSGADLRVLAIAERHTKQMAGYPHWHLLLHEVKEPVRHKKLCYYWDRTGPFDIGHTNFKLVADGRASVAYVCKYIAKHIDQRIRCSRYYGKLS